MLSCHQRFQFNKWVNFRLPKDDNCRCPAAEAEALGYDNLLFCILVLGVGMAVAVAAAAAEKAGHRVDSCYQPR